MLILAVDTSCYVASAALVRDGVCVCELLAPTEKRHAETAQPLVEALLQQTNTALAELNCFAVDVGPGSFTGVRIGVSMINAMAFAAGKPVVPVDALRTLYEPYADTPMRVCTIIDAGNGNAYAAQYEGGETLAQPDAVVTEECLSALPAGTRIVGDVGDSKAYPSAKYVGLAAEKLAGLAASEVKPVYLRPSQAERMWKLRQEAKQSGR